MKLILAGLATLAFAATSNGQDEGVSWIGRLGSPYNLSYLHAVSADGNVAVGVNVNYLNDAQTAIVWRRGTGISPLPNGLNAVAQDISQDGRTIVGRAYGTAHTACRWVDGGFESLGDLPGGNESSIAYGVSGDGSVIVGRGRNAEKSVAFRWQGVFSDLGTLPGDVGSEAQATSYGGQVIIGTSSSASDARPFRWTQEGGMVPITGSEEFVMYSTLDITPDGSIVVGSFKFPEVRAARWSLISGLESLGVPPGGTRSYANAVNGDGLIVVGGSDVDLGIANNNAMIWTPTTGMRNLMQYLNERHLSDGNVLAFEWLSNVSLDGRTLVGVGHSSTDGGSPQGFVARIPEWDTCYPTGFSVPEGLILNVSLANFFASDSNRSEVLNDDYSLGASFTFSATSPTANPSFMTFEFQGHVARTGLAQVLSLRNYVTGNYDAVDGRLAPTAETFIHAPTTNPSRYVGPGNAARARVEWFPLNDEDPAQDGWLHSINVARWRIRD